jgi:hypothetical protein
MKHFQMNRKAAMKAVALKLALLMMLQVAFPTITFALTGGPSQPEVESFEPIGTSEMVDLFSGDFTYNIPLLDVEGYPVNLSYHSGITMDQEASWVGLGWNVNAGVINRGLRGLPDDFNGDEVISEYNSKENVTKGITGSASFGFELVGKKIGGSLTTSLGVKYNNYTGWGSSIGITPGINAGEQGKLSGNASLGISASSDEGSSIQPHVGLSLIVKSGYSMFKFIQPGKASLSIGFGGSMNSRSGMQSLSVNMSANATSAGITTYKPGSNGKKSKSSASSESLGVGASYNMGPATYTPSSDMDYKSYAFTGTFTVGAEYAPGFSGMSLTGYISKQSLVNKNRLTPAYGYLYSHNGKSNDNALLDFNREGEGPFSEATTALSLTNFTYDVFSVAGQGVGGSYRAFRSDIGTVHDPTMIGTPDKNYTIEIETGAPGVAKFGGSLGFSSSTSYGGKWKDGISQSKAKLHFTSSAQATDPLYETTYFKEAGELSVDANADRFSQLGASRPVRVKLKDDTKFDVRTTDKYIDEGGNQYQMSNLKLEKRDKRNQLLSHLNKEEVMKYGVMSESYYVSQPPRPGKHIAEITTTNTDGTRYVYGLAAYNTHQKEVSFAVGEPMGSGADVNGVNWSNGLIDYSQYGTDVATAKNNRGIDNFYNSVTTPAYAHSYMLSAVLSSDYVDSDNVRGPSENDFGNYTIFTYDNKINYQWRTPFNEKMANYNLGLRTDKHDDKASFVYGKKDLCYLKTIQTRNYVAVFKTKPRRDARGVKDEDGGMALGNYQDGISSKGYMMCLEQILLFTRSEYEKYIIDENAGVPIKTVTFRYDYSLCPNVDNFDTSDQDKFKSPYTENVSPKGKLTLIGLEFTYQNSKKAKLSSYSFNYGQNNPSYNPKQIDRWGAFKMGSGQQPTALTSALHNSEYPYTPQWSAEANMNAEAWNLKKVTLPSGGVIAVDYESDSYSSVQNLDAMKMVPIVGTSNEDGTANIATSPHLKRISSEQNNAVDDKGNRWLYFKREINPQTNDLYPADAYIKAGEQLFYKAMVVFKKSGSDEDDEGADISEYIPGYADVATVENVPNSDLGRIKLKAVKLKDHALNEFDYWGQNFWSPITKTSIEFARMNLKDIVYNGDENPDDQSDLKEALLSILRAFKSMKELFSSANKYLYNKEYKPGQFIVTHKTQVRLRVPGQIKYGGGSRVKRIKIRDNFNSEMGIVQPGALSNVGMEYGQDYLYETVDGKSSGVAAYEPQIGGEENPWKKGIYGDIRFKGAPDQKFLQETPFGESFFPSASVGYSRVVVKNLSQTNVTRHATGQVVHEFYTAKDFPTLVNRTDLKVVRHKNKPHGLKALLKLNVKDFATVSQGFVIETNDMHGKPKSESVFAENGTSPISSVEYRYQRENSTNSDELSSSGKLNNICTVINQDGNVNTSAQIGVVYDVINDEQESSTITESFEAKGNIDVTMFMGITLPSIWPSKSMETTQFRSITTTKVVQRFGILEETIAQQDGSVVSTKNLAYDAETGQVLLTQTKTDYNDDVYNMNYPAYWYYREMGPAYQNIGLERRLQFDAEGKAPVTDAPIYYANGDEISLQAPNFSERFWVTEVTPYNITVMDRMGNHPPVLPYDNITLGLYNTKVMRSGFRNMQLGAMANIVTRINPLHNIRTNIYDMILQASAIEYTNEWPTACNCMNGDDNTATNNPYIRGTRGYWKPSKSFLHLAGRTQSDINGNTNLRNDGFFTSYSPFYKVDEFGNWAKDYDNWTYTSEVSIFSPYGPELENRDALGRYSSANFGFHQTLPTAVAANSRYGEMGFESFEDYIMSGVLPTLPCNNQKFRLVNLGDESESDAELVSNVSHTGRYSLKLDGKLAQDFPQPDPCINGNCNMEVTQRNVHQGEDVELVITGGHEPYNYIVQPVSGSVSHSIGLNTDSQWAVLLTGSDAFLVQVIITDSLGSTFNQIISNE